MAGKQTGKGIGSMMEILPQPIYSSDHILPGYHFLGSLWHFLNWKRHTNYEGVNIKKKKSIIISKFKEIYGWGIDNLSVHCHYVNE